MSRSSPPARPNRPAEELLRRGLELQRAGRPLEAASLYEQVLARDAAQPAANHLLGLVRLGQGRAEDAARLIGRAVAGNGGDPQYLCNLGVALNAAGRHAEAVAALDRALALKPDFAEAHSNRGMALRAAGRLDDAAESYRRAAALRPAEPGFHFNLGNVLADQGDPLAAERAYREALRLRPDYPAATSALADLLGRTARAAEAADLLEAALQRAPSDAMLHYRLGRSAWLLDDVPRAAAEFRRSVALQPGFGEAHCYLASVVRRRTRDGEVEAMAALFADPAAPLEQRIFAGFGLGKALSDLGAHTESIATFEAANRLARSRSSYSVASAVRQLQADTAGFAAVEAGDPRGGAPIFVVGLPRAGKSTVEAILDRHPAVHGVGELPTLPRLAGAFRRRHPDLAAAPPDAFAELGRAYLEEVGRLIPAGSVPVDTMPPNFRQIGFIRRALPGARIVHCVRAAGEHRVALFEKYLTAPGYEYAADLSDLLAYHRAYRRQTQQWRGLYGDAILDFDIGGLGASREAQVARLLDFCGLPRDERCFAPATSEPQLDDWSADEARRNRAAHIEAWQAAHPELWVD